MIDFLKMPLIESYEEQKLYFTEINQTKVFFNSLIKEIFLLIIKKNNKNKKFDTSRT